jgi:hypothetical protein
MESALVAERDLEIEVMKEYHRELASALQRRAAAFEPWLSHAERICSSANKKPSTSSSNGPGRCGIWGLRAPARCTTRPHRAHAANGRRLKLAVVRKIRAGYLISAVAEFHNELRKSAAVSFV